ncbi:BTB/POZ protein [Cadophora sp. MPI-SDFR-AT-0126]|nr:BTB/POZ protein [Leotiomycetes sp. MPI-SDFR-AT-0126]
MPKAPSLIEIITRCFDDDTYSDLTITCRDRSWKVHRVVVCPQSRVLNAACMTGFKEAQTGIVDLDDDDPAAVETMLRFFYTGKYIEPANESGEIRFEIRIAILIYILADKYDVSALMDLAEKSFKRLLSVSLTEEDYLSAVSDVYTLPLPTNALKAITVEHARRKFRGMLQGSKSDLVQNALLQIPEFAVDVILVFVNTPLRGRCYSCGPDQTAEALQARCVKCGKGGISLTD